MIDREERRRRAHKARGKRARTKDLRKRAEDKEQREMMRCHHNELNNDYPGWGWPPNQYDRSGKRKVHH